MTAQELRELDAWIAEHVMGWKQKTKVSDLGVMDSFYDHGDILIEYTRGHLRPWKPSEDSKDAMDVLKKCAENCPQIMISTYYGKWIVGNDSLDGLIKAETLELAICLFAKQLFSQTTK